MNNSNPVPNNLNSPFSVEPCPCGRSLDNSYNLCPTCRWEAFYASLDPRTQRSVDASKASIMNQVRRQRAERLVLEERFRFVASLATDLLLDANPAGVHRTLRPACRPQLDPAVKEVVHDFMRGQLECLEHELTRRIDLNEAIRVLAMACENTPRPDWPAQERNLAAIEDAYEASLDLLVPETD